GAATPATPRRDTAAAHVAHRFGLRRAPRLEYARGRRGARSASRCAVRSASVPAARTGTGRPRARAGPSARARTRRAQAGRGRGRRRGGRRPVTAPAPAPAPRRDDLPELPLHPEPDRLYRIARLLVAIAMRIFFRRTIVR